MTQTFKYALSACGLSQREAADFLGVSLDSVKGWAQERRPVPKGVWDMLADLYARIENAANFAADQMADNGVDPRAYQSIDANFGDDPLPEGSSKIAGAVALLMALYDKAE